MAIKYKKEVADLLNDDVTITHPYKISILLALNAKPMYLGTVTKEEKIKRRKKNKAQRAARKHNRV